MNAEVVIVIFSTIFSIGALPFIRHKRQASPPPREAPPPEMIPILNSFHPAESSICPENFYLCRDQTFCFNEAQLCGGADACPDSSDDINAICPGTTSTMSNLVTTASKSDSSNSSTFKATLNPPSTTSQSPVWPSYDVYGRPLVIAFIALVGGLFIYVALATYCCITNRWNVISPNR